MNELIILIKNYSWKSIKWDWTKFERNIKNLFIIKLKQMPKKERTFHFMYSKNTNKEEYKVRKSFTEMLKETIFKKGFSFPEMIVWIITISVLIIIYFYITK